MGEKLVIGPYNRGLTTNRTPFAIDNEAFPYLKNFYQWRGRIKRKRGTSLLSRFSIILDAGSLGTSPGTASWSFNLLTLFSISSTYSNATIAQQSVTITIGSTSVTDDGLGNLTADPAGTTGTINYLTGAVSLTLAAGDQSQVSTVTFSYYPALPVMGLENWSDPTSAYPQNIGFDTKKSYRTLILSPYTSYDVSYYKNPKTFSGYTPKDPYTSLKWNGTDYQQFWGINYANAFWATNGVTEPFVSTNLGLQFLDCSGSAYASPTTFTVTLTGSTLVEGDFVFLNEFTGAQAAKINFQTGFVSNVSGTTYTITLPNQTLDMADVYGTGAVFYLTNSQYPTLDCLRWFDGDPTNVGKKPLATTGKGWVNFTPPLLSGSTNTFSIGGLPPAQYYLVGAKLIVPFKDRLLFLGAVVQTTSGTSIYLQDTIVWSQLGTPYYTASFTATSVSDIYNTATVFNSLCVPDNQTGFPPAYVENIQGYGGFLTLGVDEAILTAQANEDVLILGLETLQGRLVYTGNDLRPFTFYIINVEYGNESTFSAVNFDVGVMAFGTRGITMTTQQECQRVDLQIPDAIFEINLANNGPERLTAQRDYINEWIYFTYNSNTGNTTYPDQTLLYNYRDQTWAIFSESYTTYGQIRLSTGNAWANIKTKWANWTDPWNSGISSLLQPDVIGGNSQGFIMQRTSTGTEEGTSLYIQDFTVASSTVTAPSHNLQSGDYILISGCLGTIANTVNNRIFKISGVTADSFVLDDSIAGDYTGGGLITRLPVPALQSKQFPVSWGLGRKTRLGPQFYLLTKTGNGQVSLLIYLSMDSSTIWNDLNWNENAAIVPSDQSQNNSLVYSAILYTCPESSNLGLTAPNTNLQMVTASTQQQIWHRLNTSLIGDVVQIGISLSDEQIRKIDVSAATKSITGATNDTRCVLTTDANPGAGQLVYITGMEGMTELNDLYWNVYSSDSSTVTLEVDSSAFGTYTSGGTIQSAAYNNVFAEIELHSMILDVNPSQILA